jgi:hypothetical protein
MHNLQIDASIKYVSDFHWVKLQWYGLYEA